MDIKGKSDESSSQRTRGSWRQYYNVPLQMFNEVRNYMPSISEYWSSGFGITSAGSANLQSPKKAKESPCEKKMNNAHTYHIGPDCNTYNLNVWDLTTGSPQSVSVVQNKANVFDMSVPPPPTKQFAFPSSKGMRSSQQPLLQPPPPSYQPHWVGSDWSGYFQQQHLHQPQMSKQKVVDPGLGYIQQLPTHLQQHWGRSYQTVPGPMMKSQIEIPRMMDRAAMLASDMATEMLVEYICQETHPNQSRYPRREEVKSNLNPNAKEFIPKHLMAHFENNQNSEYLNEAMLETAIKSSMAEAKSKLTRDKEIEPVEDSFKETCGAAFTEESMLGNPNLESDTNSCGSELAEHIWNLSSESSDQPQHSSENKVISNENKDDFSVPGDLSCSPDISSRSYCSVGITEEQTTLLEDTELDNNVQVESSSQSLEEQNRIEKETNASLDQDFRLDVENICDKLTLDSCREDQKTNHKFRLERHDNWRTLEDFLVEKEDMIPCSEDDLSLDDLLVSGCALSSGSDDESTISHTSKSFSRNLSESSEDSLVQFEASPGLSQSSECQNGVGGLVPKLLRLDSTEVGSDLSSSEDSEDDWDDDSEDEGHEVDLSQLLEFSPLLCISTLTSQPVVPLVAAVGCQQLHPASGGQQLHPASGGQQLHPASGHPVPTLRRHSGPPSPLMPVAVSVSVAAVTSLPFPTAGGGVCGSGSAVTVASCRSAFPASSDYTPSRCDNNIECNASVRTTPITTTNSVPKVSFGFDEPDCSVSSNNVSRDGGRGVSGRIGRFQVLVDPLGGQNTTSLDIAEANRKWRCMPTTPRKTSPLVKFSTDPDTIIWEPDSLTEQLHQARISDFPQRQADKERMERMLAPILTHKHRQAVYNRLHANTNQSS